jgi:hypothetical protein
LPERTRGLNEVKISVAELVDFCAAPASNYTVFISRLNLKTCLLEKLRFFCNIFREISYRYRYPEQSRPKFFGSGSSKNLPLQRLRLRNTNKKYMSSFTGEVNSNFACPAALAKRSENNY